MKIKNVQVVKPIGLNGALSDKDFDFEVNDLGVTALPKGIQSFSKKPRLIPWANVAACDLEPEVRDVIEPPKPDFGLLAMTGEPPAQTGVQPMPIPERDSAGKLIKEPDPSDDTEVAVKDQKTGIVRFEKRTGAFAKVAEAKAEQAEE